MKLKAENLIVKYGKEDILKGLNFSVNEGDFLTILGESGTGKSTILKAISGLIPLEQGTVFFDEKNITDVKTEERGMGYVFQEPLLFPHLTVKENISFGLDIKKVHKAEILSRLKELMELLKLAGLENRLPYQLSGGQQQRVAIARALATYPSLLLMDEPFSGLDISLRIEMGYLIKELQSALNLTIIFVTHDLNECLRLSDSVLLMDKGELVQYGEVNKVYYKPKSQSIASLMGGGNWIDGKIDNEVFISAFGAFNAKGMVDGNAKLFFRYHQIKVSKSDTKEDYIVEAIRPIGKEIQLIIKSGSSKIILEMFNDNCLKIGEYVELEFPKTNLHYVYESNSI